MVSRFSGIKNHVMPTKSGYRFVRLAKFLFSSDGASPPYPASAD